MKTKILKRLKETDGYVSGQDLCSLFDVSRTAVWKVVKQLKEEGYIIEAVQNKGYRLLDSADIFTRSDISSVLETKWAGQELYYYPDIDSTNTAAKKLAEEGAAHGALVVANTQSGGKGRRGRAWVTFEGSGIWMTLIIKPVMNPVNASMLTLVMALAAAKACREISGLEVQIKWPNDLVVNQKKICGILTEMSAEVDYINHIVIGTGINVNIDIFPEKIRDKATSLKLEAGRMIRRTELLNRLLVRFEEEYDRFMEQENLEGQIADYNSLLAGLDREVTVIDPVSPYNGIARGINKNGELLVDREDGERTSIYAGEVSVRGLYGYI